MEKLIGKRLKKGDYIGIVSVSAPEAYEQKERFEKGINYLKSKGYNVILSSHVTKKRGYLTETPKTMAKDLMELFANEKVKCIICAGGGSNSNTLLQYIDFKKIKDNPKIFIGVSNPTILLNAINTMTGLITFHGPSIVWDFGEENGLCKFTDNHLWSEICNGNKKHIIKDEDHTWISLKKGKASEKAYTCLKISWLYRGKLEGMDEKDASLEQERRECMEQQEAFYNQAYEGFLKAVSTEMFPMCGMDQTTVDYLLAVMSKHFKRYDTASKCISRIMSTTSASKKMKDRAYDLKEEIIREIKAAKE